MIGKVDQTFNRFFEQTQQKTDRKALYKQAEKTLQKAQEEGQSIYPVNFTLVDIMGDLDEVEGFNNNYGTITTVYQTGYGEGYELNIGGQRVMGTSRGVWQYYATPLEQMKNEEFYKIYNKELASAQQSSKNQQ